MNNTDKTKFDIKQENTVRTVCDWLKRGKSKFWIQNFFTGEPKVSVNDLNEAFHIVRGMPSMKKYVETLNGPVKKTTYKGIPKKDMTARQLADSKKNHDTSGHRGLGITVTSPDYRY